MNFELIEHALPMLLVGAGVTIEITAVSVAIGFLIGRFVGIARICQVKIQWVISGLIRFIFSSIKMKPAAISTNPNAIFFMVLD